MRIGRKIACMASSLCSYVSSSPFHTYVAAVARAESRYKNLLQYDPHARSNIGSILTIKFSARHDTSTMRIKQSNIKRTLGGEKIGSYYICYILLSEVLSILYLYRIFILRTHMHMYFLLHVHVFF